MIFREKVFFNWTLVFCELQGKKVGHHLHKFGLLSGNLDDKFKVDIAQHWNRTKNDLRNVLQIKSFLLQLLQQRIKFTPYGLFDIDLGLFSMVRKDFLGFEIVNLLSLFLSNFKITGAVVTYILILIQFDIAQKT